MCLSPGIAIYTDRGRALRYRFRQACLRNIIPPERPLPLPRDSSSIGPDELEVTREAWYAALDFPAWYAETTDR
jgi:hypothetical protein